METNNNDKNLTNKNQEESLEISSTGYGYESVTTETRAEKTKQQAKGTRQSCGDL
ncbi:hypothetical protein [Bacillus sp. ISL-7]|uniref:hypothetical protein n=1 Tax=Bacillus sp. ISL-7 TaxID=2819136 RepID=UPI001BE68FDD|nr:hypothetical protein [Bacillus sp. ISL-7]MBT2733518.1 hypothetical protein [Bacillus sp. ISL-7]